MNKAISGLAIALGGLVLVSIMACDPNPDPAQSPGPTPTPDPAQLFNSFGIDTNLPAQAADYNPFGRKVTQLQARREIFFSGLYAQGRLVNLWDDHAPGAATAKTSLIAYGSTADPAFAKKPQASAAGDIDGDGQDEVVTVYYSGAVAAGKTSGKAYLCVMGKNEALAAATEIPGNPDYAVNFADTSGFSQGRMDIALGDLDGDGTKEIALVVGDTLTILRRGPTGAMSLLMSKDFRDGKHDGAWALVPWFVRVAAGDVNGDGKDEFVSMSGYWFDNAGGYATATWAVYGGGTAAQLYAGTVSDLSGSAEILFGNVAVGDLDGNGVAEICFSGISKRATNTLIDCKVISAWWNGSGLTLPGGTKTLSYSFPSGRDQYRPMPSTCFKPRLGKAESLLALNRVIEWENNALTIKANLPENASANPDYLANFEQIMDAGDVDQDGLDEILALYIGATKTLCVYPGTGSGTLAPEETISNDTAYAYNAGSNGVYMSLCLPDWDGDSVTLSFIGSSVKYTEPRVVAVIASPPYWADLLPAESLGNYSTSFGTSQGESYERTDTFKVGLEISYSEGLSGDLGFTLEYGVAVGASFAYTKSFCKEGVMSQTETTVAGEDKVLYMSVPFDVYRFRVLTSPNAAAVGTEYSICVPRQAQIRSMERTAYNELPGNPVPIPDGFQDHSAGAPFSYPTQTAMRGLLATGGGFWDVTGKNVGRSSGSTGSAVEQSVTVGDGFAVGASAKIMGKAGVLWHTLGVEASFEYEWNSTVSTSSGTSVSGTIPDLPVSAPASKNYKYGIALYTKTLAAQESPVLVVSYWVNP